MKLLKSRLTLDDLILEIKQVSNQELKLDRLRDWMARLDLKDMAIEEHICFDTQSYQRQILYRDSSFEIVLVCWQPGQFSTIHDHNGSLNVTRVYRGILTSRTFNRNDSVTGKVFPLLWEEKYLQKDELVEVDRDRIHQLANTSEQNLVTLNLYAKPLQQMRVYHFRKGLSELMPIFPLQPVGIKIESKIPTIAIVGGGFSGSMVAVHLLKNAVSPLKIKLIERRPAIGEGVAYSTSSDCHLLNVPVGKMSAFADDRDHFWHWLQTRESGLTKTISSDDFVPRQLYGNYIRSILTEAETKANRGVSLERLRDEAIAVETDTRCATIHLSSGKSLEAERVVLALGNFPPANPAVANSAFYQSQRYAFFWSAPSLLSSLSPDEPILIMGSGLTAFDAILALDRQRHQGKIYVVSRHGLFPQTHQAKTAYPPLFESKPLPKTIRFLVRHIRQEIESAKARGDNWQSVINSLRPHTQTIWQSLTLTEQKRFLRHVRPYWEIHRHQVHSEIALLVEQKIAAGQLRLIAGRIQAFEEDAEGVNVLIRQRCNNQIDNLRASAVINCTGSECNYRQLQDPLVKNLLNSGLIKPDPLHLGLDVADNGALISREGESNLLFTLGSPQKGCLWETTAVAEIRQQAQTLAQQLLPLTADLFN
jgi:uncharacterized NAD(P)/FAD-binding protein YdhS/predicted metal-dependent enzyme (double-stranded beta helix superfamily)